MSYQIVSLSNSGSKKRRYNKNSGQLHSKMELIRSLYNIYCNFQWKN